jgi:hypothetical protein
MKRIDFRIPLGILLIFASLLGVLELAGILKDASSLFWSIALGLGAAAFLVLFFTRGENWWAAIPGFTLAGASASAFLPDRWGWSGLAMLGGIGLGFWAVYLAERRRWWAIIPGGVLVTLGFVSLASDHFGLLETGSILFMGLGITFLLVGVLARQTWAYIPATVLLILGLVSGVQDTFPVLIIWVIVLILAGGLMIFNALSKK